MIKKYPILLLGFNRPEKVLERTREILTWHPSDLYISIDGATGNHDEHFSIETGRLLDEFKEDARIHLIFRTWNHGIGDHLPTAVDEVLRSHDGVVVVEDDIQCSKVFYEEICKALTLHGNKYLTIGGFSAVSTGIFGVKNRWRETKYFSAWGWGVTRQSWSKYERTIDFKDFQTKLETSRVWQKLNLSQKETWIGRFIKVSLGEKLTWDFQMQYSSFIHEYYHLNSLFRICENHGFSDARGTNTRSKRPILLGRPYLSNSPFSHSHLSRFPTAIFEFLDSVVIAGDRVSVHRLVDTLKKISHPKNPQL